MSLGRYRDPPYDLMMRTPLKKGLKGMSLDLMLRIQEIYERSLKMADFPLCYAILDLTQDTFSAVDFPDHSS